MKTIQCSNYILLLSVMMCVAKLTKLDESLVPNLCFPLPKLMHFLSSHAPILQFLVLSEQLSEINFSVYG